MDDVLREFADRMPADASLVLGFMAACAELQRQVEAAEPADALRITRLAGRITEMARRLAPIAADAITRAGEHYSELAAAAVHVLDQTGVMASDDRLNRLGLSHLKDSPEELKKALQAGSTEFDAEVERWHREMEEEEKNSQGQK